MALKDKVRNRTLVRYRGFYLIERRLWIRDVYAIPLLSPKSSLNRKQTSAIHNFGRFQSLHCTNLLDNGGFCSMTVLSMHT
jgi:hypothetical protein